MRCKTISIYYVHSKRAYTEGWFDQRTSSTGRGPLVQLNYVEQVKYPLDTHNQFGIIFSFENERATNSEPTCKVKYEREAEN